MQRAPMAEDPTKSERDVPAYGLRALAVRRAALFSLGVLVLVFLVALGSSRSLVHIGGAETPSRVRLVAGSAIILLIAVVVALATSYVAWKLLRAFFEEAGPGERQSTWRRLLAQLAVITIAAVAALVYVLLHGAQRGGRTPLSERSLPRVTSPATGRDGRTASAQTAADLAPWVIGGALILIALLLIVLLVLRRRRHGDSEGEPLDEEIDLRRRELRETVESSLEEIEGEVDPRRAVIRAYAGMENTLAQHGLGRRRFEAPLEYLIRAFAGIHVSKSAAERLTRLFEQARFSEHQIGPEMKREAIASLTEVRNELRADSV